MSDLDSHTNDEFDLLGAWTAAKKQAESEVAELNGIYPPDVVRRLMEALTNRHFWDSRK